MIEYHTGNLLEAPVEALVNTVNEIGVMGKGVALQFKEAFPQSAREYEDAAKHGEVRVGRVLVTATHGLSGPQWVIHFPTKRHWRNPSKIEWVRDGLADLRAVIQERGIRSVALPPLGCGNGGLNWTDVRPLIEDALGKLPGVEVLVFEPSPRYAVAPKTHGRENLTPARALIAEMIRRYSVLGMGCTNLEVQKIAWFLQRACSAVGAKDPLGLRFSANRYGPYSDRLRHLLDAIDGSYVHCEHRLSEASPFDLIHFRDDRRAVVSEYLERHAAQYSLVLDATTRFIDGFESPLGMELLATVDWLVSHEGCQPTIAEIRRALAAWPGDRAAGQRKLGLFDDGMLQVALDRVNEGLYAQQQELSFG